MTAPDTRKIIDVEIWASGSFIRRITWPVQHLWLGVWVLLRAFRLGAQTEHPLSSRRGIISRILLLYGRTKLLWQSRYDLNMNIRRAYIRTHLRVHTYTKTQDGFIIDCVLENITHKIKSLKWWRFAPMASLISLPNWEWPDSVSQPFGKENVAAVLIWHRYCVSLSLKSDRLISLVPAFRESATMVHISLEVVDPRKSSQWDSRVPMQLYPSITDPELFYCRTSDVLHLLL